MKFIYIFIALLISLFIWTGCQKRHSVQENEDASELDLPGTPYQYTTGNSDMVTLGRVLFYDKKLSQNNSVSCGSCHQQSHAFCDNQQFSSGLEEQKTRRNTPGIFSHGGNFFWDGRAGNLNTMVLMPIKNHVEMKSSDIDALVDKISQQDYYPQLFNRAFGNPQIDSNRVKIALSAFVDNFRFSTNKFNRVRANTESFTAMESLGKSIFFGNGRCSRCHHIEDPNPTGGGNGYGSVPSLPRNKFNIGLEETYTDHGIAEITKDPSDEGKFIVPVLLNAEFTGPYMHDGRYKTLEEVVEHYNSGIYTHSNLAADLRDLGTYENLTEQEKLNMFDTNHNGIVDASEVSSYPAVRLNLTATEKDALVSFLKTLSDASIYTDKRFSNPFK
jgi:cytochrome c peroxidase